MPQIRAVMQEGQAIAMLKRGDLNGLEQLVGHYQIEAVQTAYLIVGDRALAEDIAQSSFLKAAERIHQFKDGHPFRPWILRIVAHDAIKAYSRAKRHVSLEGAQELDAPPGWLRDGNPGPEELADTAENRRMVWEALRRLTPKQRAAIVMRYFLDMKDREISRELDRSLSSVKWSIHAAKRRLQSLLGFADLPTSQSSSEGDRSPGVGGEQ